MDEVYGCKLNHVLLDIVVTIYIMLSTKWQISYTFVALDLPDTLVPLDLLT